MTTNALRKADAKLRSAMVAADVLCLQALLAPDLRWVHASGRIDTRETLIEAFATSRLRCLSMAPVFTLERIDRETGILGGRLAMEVLTPDGERSSTNLFVAVWSVNEDDGTLKLLAWQSTRQE